MEAKLTKLYSNQGFKDFQLQIAKLSWSWIRWKLRYNQLRYI